MPIYQNRSTVASPIAYKLNIKRAIVKALRDVFDSDYPDFHQVIPNLFISLEWPDKPEQYPAIIVVYNETGPLSSAGIAHFEHVLGGPNVYRRWVYSGEIQLLVIAESALQRDYISEHLIHLLAVGNTSGHTANFIPSIERNQGLDVQILKDSLTPRGESVEKGTDWGLEDMTLFMAGYSFSIVGSFTSGIVYNAYIRGVNESAEAV